MSHYQIQIARAFDFTSNDLRANQTGKMTPRQQQRIKPSVVDYLQKVGLTALVVLIGIVLGGVESVLNPDPILDIGVNDVVIASGIIAIVALLVLIGLLFHEFRVLADARGGIADAVTGSITIHHIDTASGTVSKLIVGRAHHFGALSDTQRAILEDINTLPAYPQITVYCTPRTRKLLSLELANEVDNV